MESWVPKEASGFTPHTRLRTSFVVPMQCQKRQEENERKNRKGRERNVIQGLNGLAYLHQADIKTRVN